MGLLIGITVIPSGFYLYLQFRERAGRNLGKTDADGVVSCQDSHACRY